MVRGSSTRATRDQDTRAPAGGLQPTGDTSVEWAARVVAPTSAVRSDSTQPVAVEVAAPVVLAGQSVRVGVAPRGGRGTRWQDATWHGDPGQRRTVVGTLGRGDLRLPKGMWRVLVNVGGVVLNAGAIVVTD